MVIYRVYSDFSDAYNQAFKEYDYYLDKDKALIALEKVIRVEIKSVDEEQISKLSEEWIYEIEYVGYYGVGEIEVIE
ncbi:hypothetical protein [Metabacillus arenae]|uniref:Uncharacterized protein n=1 Tax=Metabacillus arenae TaxID=2771434 RepID=A0A926NFP2_9BACI|nr:hypothetical protein [Metabacillus arenae]MBD1379148.1 hypothetical protein [Metabacillus arenae]